MIKVWNVMPVAFLAISVLTGYGQSLNYSVAPQAKDNFLEASFRFANPDPQNAPTVILVYIPGTDDDARWVVEDPKFLATCKVCHAALLGCYFRGEGLDYDSPSGGSGQALDLAISYFAKAIKCPGLSKAPLLLFGHSQGAQFTFNYLCWRPERVKAFAALRPGNFQLEPQKASFRVPGLIAAGENDESGRIRTAAKAYLKAASKHPPWAFLLEKNAGHEMARSNDLARRFFESVCNGDVERNPAGVSTEIGEPTRLSSGTPNLCWLPNQSIADDWKLLHKPSLLKSLATLPDKPAMGKLISATLTPDCFISENGSMKSGTLDLNATQEGVIIDDIYVVGSGFALEETRIGKLPIQIKIRFAPQALDWGHLSASIVVNGQVDGHRAGSLEIGLSGMVKGPLIPFPALVYLGVANSGQRMSQTVLLRSDKTKVHISSIKSPHGITATIDPQVGTKRDIQLHIFWLPGNRYGRMLDEIRIELDSPQKGELRIPIIGVVSKPNS